MLVSDLFHVEGSTHGSIFGGLGMTTLERDEMTLVLETLRGDETLDLGGLGVWFLALALGLDFATNDEFADLVSRQHRLGAHARFGVF